MDDESVQLYWDTRLISTHAVASLAFFTWEVLINLGQEVEYIWSRPNRSPMKWIFITMRYSTLGNLIWTVVLNLEITSGVATNRTCQSLLISHGIGGTSLLGYLQIILFLRVYALYSKSRWIAIVAITICACEIIMLPISVAAIIPLMKVEQRCMRPLNVRDIVLFGVFIILPPIMFMNLSLVKYMAGRQQGWARRPFIFRLVRDGVSMVMLLASCFMMNATFTNMNPAYGYSGFQWTMSVVPALACRLLISMQKFATPNASESGTTVSSPDEFTTCILDLALGSTQLASRITSES